MERVGTVVTHNKTGKEYVVVAHAKDCTNARAGTRVVLYCAKDDPANLFVRDELEFQSKFTYVDTFKGIQD